MSFHPLLRRYNLRRLLRFFLCFIFLNSCTNHSSWQNSQIYSQDPEYTSKRFVFQDEEMSLEIIAYHQRTKCYLNFLDPFSSPETRQISLILKSEDKTIEGNAHYLKGGQKILFSKDLSKQLIELLKEKKQITIYFEGNQLDVLPDDFIDLFEKKQNKVAQLITSFF